MHLLKKETSQDRGLSESYYDETRLKFPVAIFIMHRKKPVLVFPQLSIEILEALP